MTYQQITFDDDIKFNWRHDRYGRAEFVICPVFRRGYLKELYITAMQQEREDTKWMLRVPDNSKITQFRIQEKNTFQAVRVWIETWCNEHKALSHRLYVPDKSHRMLFRLSLGSCVDIFFE